jgi:hypothetical protein
LRRQRQDSEGELIVNPITIIAEAIHDAECGCGQMEAVALNTASVAAGALVDERIVDHAASALVAALGREGFSVVQSGEPAGVGDLRDLAAAVLRSVGA